MDYFRQKTHDEPTESTKVVTSRNLTFVIPSLSGQYHIPLIPRQSLSSSFDKESVVAQSIHTVWDLKQFQRVRRPLEICALSPADGERFSKQSHIRILDMPIKLAGSNDYRLPIELEQFQNVIQQIIDHEHAMLDDTVIEKYHAYLTVDQSIVQKGTTQRNQGAHVDGFQGARINPKTFVNHSYVIVDRDPTTYYPQAFDFTGLDERLHDFFREMDKQASERDSIKIRPHSVYLMDAYTVHKASIAQETGSRTFVRVSYDTKRFDRLGNTHNPHFNYDWQMIPRDVHASLQEYIP